MSVSISRKIGIAARIFRQQVRETRTFKATVLACRATAAHFGGVLSQLWLEITGFVFLVLSAVGGFALAHEWSKYQVARSNFNRLVLAVCFTLMFGWFGISSFWRVRKKSKY
jgi:hypothetical protein